jgi:ATP-binding cassette subfamily B protein
MIYSYYGKRVDLTQVKSLFSFTRIGVSVQDILDMSPKLGLNATGLKLHPNELREIPLPAIIYWKQEHFIVLEYISHRSGKTYYHIADPAYGRIVLEHDSFVKEWKGTHEKGIAIIEQKADDYNNVILLPSSKTTLLRSTFFQEAIKFVKSNNQKYVASLLLILFALAANWLIPFTFQRMIDKGIAEKALSVVYFLLAAQLVLFASNFASIFFSNLLLTKINFALSIDLKKNLLSKIMRLPIRFFDTRLNTETLQRIGDQQKIQNFVTWKGISFLLDVLNLIVFGSILLYYNLVIFTEYAILSTASVLWVLFFLKKRSILEYAMFLKQSENDNNVYEFIINMPEIKINNAQNKVIGKILSVINKLNVLQLRSLFLNTYQTTGVSFLSKFNELIAIGICAVFVVEKEMTLGVLLSISYVIGQLKSPVNGLVGFIRDMQDATIANSRIGEIYNQKDDDVDCSHHITDESFNQLSIENVSFKYPGNYSPYVLQDVNFTVPRNTVTAIVGASGSGKTTLLKLLLAYYPPTQGSILLGNISTSEVYANEWRERCGVVLQDGKIFSGTIVDNIAFADSYDRIDEKRLLQAAQMACMDDFIHSLPMGFHTKVGNAGVQLSGGQQQRLLIARAVYRDTPYLFLDEATSALDAENERRIHDNLYGFFKGKTVLIIAHRLSTVKKADQIIVLKDGRITEQGAHEQLIAHKGDYFNLIKNQLELGK